MSALIPANQSTEGIIVIPSLSQALITLIFKKDKDPTECKRYCPICLIPVDVKSKIPANRLDSVITSLVHGDQVGFIHGRTGADNIWRLDNIMWAMAAISLYAEKAFDWNGVIYLRH